MSVDALFIADLHLQVGEPDTIALACQFLRSSAVGVPKLFILGDLVEYWIGDDADDGSLDAIFDELALLSASGTHVFVMHGNRDFLLGQAFAQRIGATLITEDTFVLETPALSLLLMHGDTLCTDDAEYQAMRVQFHSAQWQQIFLSQPVAKRREFADGLRKQSQTLSAKKEHALMDVNDLAAQQSLREAGTQTLVHGHTHKPAQHALTVDGATAYRYVLGDWHADHAIVGVLEGGQFRLQEFRA